MLSLTLPLHLGQVSGSPSVPLILATSMPCTGRRVSAESASVQSPQPAPDDHIEIQKILQFLKKQIAPMTYIMSLHFSSLLFCAHIALPKNMSRKVSPRLKENSNIYFNKRIVMYLHIGFYLIVVKSCTPSLVAWY